VYFLWHKRLGLREGSGGGVGAGGKEWALRSWISFKVNKRKDPTMLKATKQSWG